jgi:hypothetical protein
MARHTCIFARGINNDELFEVVESKKKEKGWHVNNLSRKQLTKT